MKKLRALCAILLAIIGSLTITNHATAASIIDNTPTVGITTTIDATQLCPAGSCSYDVHIDYRKPGCCGTVVTIIRPGRTAITEWTPTALDATRASVTIVVDVGVPNPANHLVKHAIYQQTYTVQPAPSPD